MESDLRTAILIDGSPDPPAIRIEEKERKAFIAQGRAGQVPRNFEFVGARQAQVEGEAEPRTVYLYRLKGGQFTDDEFKAMAEAEADKHLHPEKYLKVTSKPLGHDERAEYEEYKRRFGALKREV